MPSEESIRTDASTVHRTYDPNSDAVTASGAAPGSGDGSGSGVAVGNGDAEPLEQAKTVIRGSSRIEKTNERESLDRTPAAVAQVLLGQKLNHFFLEELIGGGGMGAVFRAHDEKLDRTVAIKVIPFVGNDPDLQRRFRNEAQSAAKLDHPRIARVFDTGSHDEWHYIVFEYIQGTNIRDLVNSQGVMSIDEAVFYTSQLAGALQHAAERGIVHRDIKPSNVLIGTEGKIKIVDMGLARSDNIELSEDMTASGVTLGTFDYISPEQAQDPRDADLRSDIYSLGCTLYFMLTGQPPYPGGTMLQKLLSHGNAPPPDARELRPQVSDNLAAVICKMLAKNPADRYQTSTDLIADLREVAFRDGLIRSQALGPVTISQPNPIVVWAEKNAPWMVAAALLIAGAGWLQLESAASRTEIEISPTARRPLAVPVPQRSDDSSPQPSPTIPLDSTPLDSTTDDNQAAADSQASGSQAVGSQASGSQASGTQASRTQASGTQASGTQASGTQALGPPELPPTLGNITAPRELSDPVATAPDLLPESSGNDDPFTIRSPALIGEDDISIEPLGSDFPIVVRLIDAADQTEYGRDLDGAALATSLSKALELAAGFNARRIEIAVPIIYSEPVKVAVDDLLITSTVGGSAIVFQPADSVAMERSKMFSIGKHPIEFDDIHFFWTVPSGDIDGGTLLEINDNPLVRLTDCSITVSNPTLRDEVYAVDVITDPDKLSVDREREGQADEFPKVWLELNNVVIRGQMTMLHMDFAAKLALSWDNGLLAVTERMIDTSGAREKPPATTGPISLSFTRVTAHAPKGIVRMRAGVSGAHSIPIDRRATKSLFLVDPSTPHFDISGLVSIDNQSSMLRLHGSSNAYVVDTSLGDPMLRVATSSGDAEITRMSDLETRAPSWWDETKPRWSVNWKTGIRYSELLASQRVPSDYAISDVSAPGCDEKSLPTILGPSIGENEVSSAGSTPKGPENREGL